MPPSKYDKLTQMLKCDVRYPSEGFTLDTAWMGIYQIVLWYTSPDSRDGYDKPLPHVHDRPALFDNKRWVQRARKFEEYLADALKVFTDELPEYLDV